MTLFAHTDAFVGCGACTAAAYICAYMHRRVDEASNYPTESCDTRSSLPRFWQLQQQYNKYISSKFAHIYRTPISKIFRSNSAPNRTAIPPLPPSTSKEDQRPKGRKTGIMTAIRYSIHSLTLPLLVNSCPVAVFLARTPEAADISKRDISSYQRRTVTSFYRNPSIQPPSTMFEEAVGWNRRRRQGSTPKPPTHVCCFSMSRGTGVKNSGGTL